MFKLHKLKKNQLINYKYMLLGQGGKKKKKKENQVFDETAQNELLLAFHYHRWPNLQICNFQNTCIKQCGWEMYYGLKMF